MSWTKLMPFRLGEILPPNFIFVLFLAGCGWPIPPEKLPDLIRELGKDTASGCFAVAGRAGGATVAMPAPIVPGGAYGSGEVLLARVNAPDTKVSLTINGANCTIERGPGPTIITPDMVILPAQATIP